MPTKSFVRSAASRIGCASGASSLDCWMIFPASSIATMPCVEPAKFVLDPAPVTSTGQ